MNIQASRTWARTRTSQDQYENEDEGDGGRRGFRHLIPELVHDADCCSRHPPSIWEKGVASSLLDNGQAEEAGHGAIVEEARGRRWPATAKRLLARLS